MADETTMTRERFWQEVGIASARAGSSHVNCTNTAYHALRSFDKRFRVSAAQGREAGSSEGEPNAVSPEPSDGSHLPGRPTETKP